MHNPHKRLQVCRQSMTSTSCLFHLYVFFFFFNLGCNASKQVNSSSLLFGFFFLLHPSMSWFSAVRSTPSLTTQQTLAGLQALFTSAPDLLLLLIHSILSFWFTFVCRWRLIDIFLSGPSANALLSGAPWSHAHPRTGSGGCSLSVSCSQSRCRLPQPAAARRIDAAPPGGETLCPVNLQLKDSTIQTTNQIQSAGPPLAATLPAEQLLNGKQASHQHAD